MSRGTRQPAPNFKHDSLGWRVMVAMPFEGHEKLAKFARPDKAEAALLLRQLAFDPGFEQEFPPR